MFGVKLFTTAGMVYTGLKDAARRAGRTRPVVQVGYDTPYAIYVHENLTANHPVGQAKFLEQPARDSLDQIIDIVKRTVANKGPLHFAVMAAGQHLRAQSLPLVPVDTGLLKSTAFVEAEN